MNNTNLRIFPFTRWSPIRQSGMTLVELLIAMTLGLFLMAALTSLMLYQTSTRDELDKSSRQIENGRYAMQILHDDIELAGYYGQLWNIPSTNYPLPGTPPDPCVDGTNLAGLASAVPLPIQGYDNPLSSALPTCLSSANQLGGTDILVIRRADAPTIAISATAAAAVYIQANGSAYTIGKGSPTSAFTLTVSTNTITPPCTTSPCVLPAPLHAYLVHIYFISKCSKVDPNGACMDTIPTLKRLELDPTDGTFHTLTPTPLVEGIENMQLDYGIDNLPVAVIAGATVVGDGYPDTYVTTPASAVDATPPTNTYWSNVVSIRVNLLARNNDSTAGYTTSKTYTLTAPGVVDATGATSGVAVGPYPDSYKRHVFTEVVRAINLTGRRAQE